MIILYLFQFELKGKMVTFSLFCICIKSFKLQLLLCLDQGFGFPIYLLHLIKFFSFSFLRRGSKGSRSLTISAFKCGSSQLFSYTSCICVEFSKLSTSFTYKFAQQFYLLYFGDGICCIFQGSCRSSYLLMKMILPPFGTIFSCERLYLFAAFFSEVMIRCYTLLWLSQNSRFCLASSIVQRWCSFILSSLSLQKSSMAFSRQITLLMRKQTSVCYLTSSLHLSTLRQKAKHYQFSAGPYKKVAMQQNKQIGNRRIWNLSLSNSEFYLSLQTKSLLPISNQNAYSLKALKPQNSNNIIPNKPPKYAKVASNRVQLRLYCWMRSDFLSYMRTNSSVLMTSKLLTTGLQLRVRPFSVVRSECGSGQMLLSVLTSYSEKKMWELTPIISVNSKQFESQSTQSKYCFQLASIIGLAKQTLNLNVFCLSSKSISSLLDAHLLVQLRHLRTTSFEQRYSSEVNLPLKMKLQSLGGHSHCLKLSLEQIFLNSSLIPSHCQGKQGDSWTSQEALKTPFLQTLLVMKISKNFFQAVRSTPSSPTANMKAELLQFVLKEEPKLGFSPVVFLIVERLMVCLQKLKKMTMKKTTMMIEAVEPAQVWWAPYPRYLSSQGFENRSNLRKTSLSLLKNVCFLGVLIPNSKITVNRFEIQFVLIIIVFVIIQVQMDEQE